MIICWSFGVRLPCDGWDVTDMLSRIVAPVSCQPMPQGLPPDTVIEAEPWPPQGRYGGFDSQAGTESLEFALAICVPPELFNLSAPSFCFGIIGTVESAPPNLF